MSIQNFPKTWNDILPSPCKRTWRQKRWPNVLQWTVDQVGTLCADRNIKKWKKVLRNMLTEMLFSIPLLCKKIELNCFNIVLHPPPKRSTQTNEHVQSSNCVPPWRDSLPAKNGVAISPVVQTNRFRIIPGFDGPGRQHPILTQWPVKVHLAEPQCNSANPTANLSPSVKWNLLYGFQRGVMLRSGRGQQWLKRHRTPSDTDKSEESSHQVFALYNRAFCSHAVCLKCPNIYT